MHLLYAVTFTQVLITRTIFPQFFPFQTLYVPSMIVRNLSSVTDMCKESSSVLVFIHLEGHLVHSSQLLVFGLHSPPPHTLLAWVCVLFPVFPARRGGEGPLRPGSAEFTNRGFRFTSMEVTLASYF